MSTTPQTWSYRWVRADDGMIGGVCLGLARQFGIDPVWMRVGWLISVLFFCSGIIPYFLCVLAFPRSDRLEQANGKKILGVCSRLAARGQMDVGLVRLLALIAFLTSAGLVLVGYFALHFILPWPSPSDVGPQVSRSIL